MHATPGHGALDAWGCLVLRRLGFGTDRRIAGAVARSNASAGHLVTRQPRKAATQCATVTYYNGVLTISAYNSTLSDILRKISSQTGADIDIPPQAEERVVTRLGPGPARDVVRSLLSGSRFNYILVGSNTSPNTLTRILLFPRPIAEKIPEPPLVNASPVQQARSLAPESNNVTEGVQQEDKPQEPELPVRAEQRILQQRRQTIMEALHENQQPESR